MPLDQLPVLFFLYHLQLLDNEVNWKVNGSSTANKFYDPVEITKEEDDEVNQRMWGILRQI